MMSLFPLHSFHTLPLRGIRFPCLTAIRCMWKVHYCACLATAIAISLDLQVGSNHMKQINQIDVKIGELDLATCQILVIVSLQSKVTSFQQSARLQ